MRVTRRKLFFTAAAMALLPSVLPAAAAEFAAPVDLHRRVRGILGEIFPDMTAPQAIGRAYLARHQEEADVRRLVHAVIGDRPPADAGSLARSLRQRRSKEFRDGDTVIVDGWVLARSEARLCALAVLL